MLRLVSTLSLKHCAVRATKLPTTKSMVCSNCVTLYVGVWCGRAILVSFRKRWAGNRDPLDVALLLDEPCFPGCLVEARLLGAIGYIKDGEQNDRLIACPLSQHGSAEAWADVHTLDDLSPRLLKELEGFFVDYQTFEGKEAKVTDRRDAEATMETVHAAVRAWKEKQQSDEKS